MGNKYHNNIPKTDVLNWRDAFPCRIKNHVKTPLPVTNSQQGFTLIELVIAIAILSILVGIASPMYSNYVQQSKITEALATLGALSTQMEKQYLDFRKYTVDDNCAVSNPTSDNFNYNCASSGQDFTWTATSNNGDYKYSINNEFNKVTLAFDGQSMSAVDCWMISNTGTCF